MTKNGNKQAFLDAKADIEEMSPQIKQAYGEALEKSSKKEELQSPGKSFQYIQATYTGSTDKSLRDEVTKASTKAMPFELAETLRNSLIKNGLASPERFKETIAEMNSSNPPSTNGSPALGYFVAMVAKEKNIPVSVISSTSHADHAVPATLATGLLSEEELRNAKKLEVFDSQGSYNEKFIFRNVLFVQEKTPEMYDMAIDQIEGKSVKTSDGGNLEARLTTSVLAFVGSAFFLSFNLTGNAIGSLSTSSSSIIGASLLIVGLVAGLFWVNFKRKKK